jgi:adenine deaminase
LKNVLNKSLRNVISHIIVYDIRNWRELGVSRIVDPLMTLCFMALPVILELKITDMGLFDVGVFRFIPIEVE